MDFSDFQSFTNNNGPTQYHVKPRQPIVGKQAIAAITTIFEYDIITPYGMGANVAANSAQDPWVMVGWGMIVRLALLAPSAATLTILADLVDGTYTEIDTSPVAVIASAKIQVFSFGPIPAFKIRGRLTGADTFTWHASCTDY